MGHRGRAPLHSNGLRTVDCGLLRQLPGAHDWLQAGHIPLRRGWPQAVVLGEREQGVPGSEVTILFLCVCACAVHPSTLSRGLAPTSETKTSFEARWETGTDLATWGAATVIMTVVLVWTPLSRTPILSPTGTRCRRHGSTVPLPVPPTKECCRVNTIVGVVSDRGGSVVFFCGCGAGV